MPCRSACISQSSGERRRFARFVSTQRQTKAAALQKLPRILDIPRAVNCQGYSTFSGSNVSHARCDPEFITVLDLWLSKPAVGDYFVTIQLVENPGLGTSDLVGIAAKNPVPRPSQLVIEVPSPTPMSFIDKPLDPSLSSLTLPRRP